MRVQKLLLMLFLLPLSLLVKANNEKEGKNTTEPVLLGSVADATTKKPMQGVIVSISSSIKGVERREITTDASGNFKVPPMPAGEITIILEKKGYKTFRREGILIKDGVSQKLTFDMCCMDESNEDASDIFHPLMRIMDGL